MLNDVGVETLRNRADDAGASAQVQTAAQRTGGSAADYCQTGPQCVRLLSLWLGVRLLLNRYRWSRRGRGNNAILLFDTRFLGKERKRFLFAQGIPPIQAGASICFLVLNEA